MFTIRHHDFSVVILHIIINRNFGAQLTLLLFAKIITILRIMQEKNENSKNMMERLVHFIDSKGESFNQLAQNIGVSNSYFSKMLKNNGSIGLEILTKIVLFYDNLNVDWLITGRGNMLRNEENIFDSEFDSGRLSYLQSLQCENKCLKEQILLLHDHLKDKEKIILLMEKMEDR